MKLHVSFSIVQEKEQMYNCIMVSSAIEEYCLICVHYSYLGETFKENIATPEWLHDLVLTKIRVPVKPILLAVAGLPGCDKSQPLIKMLNQAVSESKEAMQGLKRDDRTDHDGITYYEFAATIVTSLTGPEQPIYSETSKETFPLFAMEFALKCVARDQHAIVSRYDATSLQEQIFKDPELNEHFRHIFDRLCTNHEIPPKDDAIKVMKRTPSDLALVNVWDIGVNKAVFHFLPALWGYLDRSFLWLFLSLDRDANSLYDLPDIHENECKDKHDKNQIMRYRTRLHYFLRYVMLVNPRSNCFHHQNVSSVFAISEQTSADDLQRKVKEEISNVASQMKIDRCIDINNVELLQRGKNDAKVLKRELDHTVNQTLDSSETLPISFIFLRSLFYKLTKLYIKKDDLKAKAAQLRMSDKDVNDFCRLFMSSGSLFDISQIDKESPYIIVKPMGFMRELDKIFYPRVGIDSRVTEYGLVTVETAGILFEDYQFFMDVLVSVDLALMLRGNQICLEGKMLEDDVYYYIPDVRTQSPELHCDPTSLHLLLNVDCPLSHLQVLFARAFMSRKKCSHLILEHSTPVNITRFGTKLSDGATDVTFEMRYLGDTIEFHFPDEANEEVCTDIIEACNEVMAKDDWMNSKYAFAVMPPDSINPNIRNRCNRHVLLSLKDCDSRDDSSNHFVIWKKVLKEVKLL